MVYIRIAADYKQAVLTLVGNLKQLRNFSEKLHLDKLIQLTETTIHRVETDSFAIAVVGEFKRGKSTFINAILGEEILPADVLPATATLNRVTYGSKPFVKIIFKDDEERQIAIHKLVSFVTKVTPESEAVAATVKEAVIYYPVNYCRNNASPTIAGFIEFGQRCRELGALVTFDGVAFTAEEADVAVDAITIVGVKDLDFVGEFVKFTRGCDEIEVSSQRLFAWWD